MSLLHQIEEMKFQLEIKTVGFKRFPLLGGSLPRRNPFLQGRRVRDSFPFSKGTGKTRDIDHLEEP